MNFSTLRWEDAGLGLGEDFLVEAPASLDNFPFPSCIMLCGGACTSAAGPGQEPEEI